MNHRIDAEYWQLIWTNFKAGDQNAFKTIYNEFVDALFSYGSKISSDRDLVKDAIQDLFIDVYTYGNKLRKPESLEFYLYKSLKRILIHKLTERHKFSSVHEIKDIFDLKFSIEEDLADDYCEGQIKKIKDEIEQLTPKKREILFLKFNSGLTYKEIGKLLEINPDSAKKQVYRILDTLRKKLSNDVIVLFTIC
ncbi:RNA polymerase sigma factor [Maribellus mangrovi]|uniref:RNA polymerase sigma factor n=1 Tax=Maribellus mangrovi TaxID=3133146 RepID=UPI0030EF2A7C